ncbi:SDR family oxidoreductase [Mycobacteroides abscessus]|uniref:SDR family oxidoreductase n=1 Tax=Mycobacteroides abscessus TaxID=36809 RepID=UPI0012FFE7FE|nr:SDR family oxidoreductase [Mycobacteroides abscessus]
MSKHILVTGATGVLGSALIANLAAHKVTALVHKRPTRATTAVVGDITRARLGIDKREYQALCANVDIVIHCAGVVDFTADATAMRTVNVEGVRRITEFAADADAEMIHVSTAYVARRDTPKSTTGSHLLDPVGYIESKCLGEDMLREAGVAASIVRPSIIVGDSKTGYIAEYQGLHKFIRMILANRVPFIPAVIDSYIDMVPQDVVVAALVGLVSGDLAPGEYWITSGTKALTARALLRLLKAEAATNGIDLSGLRILNPEMVDRLMRPAFFDEVPESFVRRLEQLMTICSQLFTEEVLPSSFDHLDPQDAVNPENVWQLAIRHVLHSRDRRLADTLQNP